jgi:hypothetical protein
MATVVKDFKVKAGLVVEGSTGTINGKNILREDDSDQYIIDIIGGQTLVTSVDSDDFTVTGGELTIATGSDIARDGDITSAIDALTTDVIEEGSNLYFTTTRVDNHLSGGDGITYSSGTISADVAGGLHIDNAQVKIDRTVVDTWYEDNGAVSDHNNLTTGVHGVDGDVVGTTDTQDLSNKRVIDTLYFSDGVTVSEEGEIAVRSVSHDFDIQANQGDLHLKTVHTDGTTGSDVKITSTYGDIVLSASGAAYYGSSSTAGNEIATQGYVDTAEQDAKDYTDLLLGDATIDGSGGNTVTARIATAVADLVDGAPELLDTLNELAAAIGDSVDAQGLAVAIGNKLPLAGGTMTGAIAMGTNKITGLGTPTSNTDAATKAYVDDQTTTDVAEGTNLYFTNQRALDATAAAYDIAGAAATAEQNAKDYADDLTTSDIAEGTNLYFTNQRAIDAVGGTIGDQIDLLDTDDIEEGATNLYYTDARAKAEASALLTNATKTNITITADGSNNLTITAENGVGDSDTDDLTEGSTNLYFTDSRAVDALEAVVPNFTAVEVNSLAKQIAATVSAPTGGSQVTAYDFSHAVYRSAKFLVKTAYGTHTELSEVLITLDTANNIAITEYAIVGTNGSSSTITADIDGLKVRLRVTPTNNTSTVTVVGTLLA